MNFTSCVFADVSQDDGSARVAVSKAVDIVDAAVNDKEALFLPGSVDAGNVLPRESRPFSMRRML